VSKKPKAKKVIKDPTRKLYRGAVVPFAGIKWVVDDYETKYDGLRDFTERTITLKRVT
jgi:hypothetical protein